MEPLYFTVISYDAVDPESIKNGVLVVKNSKDWYRHPYSVVEYNRIVNLEEALKEASSKLKRGQRIFVIIEAKHLKDAIDVGGCEEVIFTDEAFATHDIKYLERNNFIVEHKYSKKLNRARPMKPYSQESVYHELMSKVLDYGEERKDRTGVGTISVFGEQISFDLSKGFPLLTAKSVPFRLVFEELMWFLRGQTNNKILRDKDVHIWDGNAGDNDELGPIYGAQWRNFGGNHDANVTNHIADGGVDQIDMVMKLLKHDPHSRRILVSAWNPKVLNNVKLPPCHVMFQFYVRKDTYLDCKVVLRSNDLFLGAPFNIASYALLTHMMCHFTDYKPGRLIYSTGDAHIYSNHVKQVNEMLSRPLRPLPTLQFINPPGKIDDFTFENIKLENYHPHSAIKAPMAV